MLSRGAIGIYDMATRRPLTSLGHIPAMITTDIYKVFAEAAAGVNFACGPGCATCCTRSVTLTTAEGRVLDDFLRDSGRVIPGLPLDQVALRPSLTTNGLAACYLAGQEVGEEAESPWLFEPCFFLCEGLCSVYEARPFACRGFGSTVNCGTSGMAEAPEWLLTLTIVTNQILENLDRGGLWGNLADVLAFLGAGAGEEASLVARSRLLPNQPAPGLLVVPEELALVENYLARLGKATGLDFGGLLRR